MQPGPERLPPMQEGVRLRRLPTIASATAPSIDKEKERERERGREQRNKHHIRNPQLPTTKIRNLQLPQRMSGPQHSFLLLFSHVSSCCFVGFLISIFSPEDVVLRSFEHYVFGTEHVFEYFFVI